MPVYLRDCSALSDLESGRITADECVVTPWRWFFLVWEGYPPYGGEFSAGKMPAHERVVHAAAEDAVRVIAAHYGMRAWTFILNRVGLNVYEVDDRFWEEMACKRKLCFARYADGRVLIPGRLPIVERSDPDLEWDLEQDRQYIALLKQEASEAHLTATTMQSPP